ncbi:hypothetical protein COX84_01715, partial [Candidatus Micrarchaeota archaeon CG_4_10_14_0_2_um_filter_49_7]
SRDMSVEFAFAILGNASIKEGARMTALSLLGKALRDVKPDYIEAVVKPKAEALLLASTPQSPEMMDAAMAVTYVLNTTKEGAALEDTFLNIQDVAAAVSSLKDAFESAKDKAGVFKASKAEEAVEILKPYLAIVKPELNMAAKGAVEALAYSLVGDSYYVQAKGNKFDDPGYAMAFLAYDQAMSKSSDYPRYAEELVRAVHSDEGWRYFLNGITDRDSRNAAARVAVKSAVRPRVLADWAVDVLEEVLLRSDLDRNSVASALQVSLGQRDKDLLLSKITGSGLSPEETVDEEALKTVFGSYTALARAYDSGIAANTRGLASVKMRFVMAAAPAQIHSQFEAWRNQQAALEKDNLAPIAGVKPMKLKDGSRVVEFAEFVATPGMERRDPAISQQVATLLNQAFGTDFDKALQMAVNPNIKIIVGISDGKVISSVMYLPMENSASYLPSGKDANRVELKNNTEILREHGLDEAKETLLDIKNKGKTAFVFYEATDKDYAGKGIATQMRKALEEATVVEGYRYWFDEVVVKHGESRMAKDNTWKRATRPLRYERDALSGRQKEMYPKDISQAFYYRSLTAGRKGVQRIRQRKAAKAMP